MAMKQKNLPEVVPELFEHEQFGSVRVVKIDGVVWFVGVDVARALGYKNGSRDVNRHVDSEDKLEYRIGTSGQQRKVILINKSGVYSLILDSKMPNAKKFRHWVTSEVLVKIDETGYYSVGKTDKLVLYTGVAPELLEPMTEEEFFDVIGKLAEAERIEIQQG